MAAEDVRTLFNATTLKLNRKTPVRFLCSASMDVVCLSGTAWITKDSDNSDVVLEASQTHGVSDGDQIYINGLPNCEIRFEVA